MSNDSFYSQGIGLIKMKVGIPFCKCRMTV